MKPAWLIHQDPVKNKTKQNKTKQNKQEKKKNKKQNKQEKSVIHQAHKHL